MNTLDPGSLGICDWYLDQVTTTLAAAIANAAMDDADRIPPDLLAAYHDASQLQLSLKLLDRKLFNAAMKEVTA